MEPERDALVIAAPVLHKGGADGTVVTTVPVAALLRNLLTVNARGGYRELLLTADGGQVRRRGRDIQLDARQRRLLAGLDDNTVLPAAPMLGEPFDGPLTDDMVLVKTSVPGMPLVLITFVPEKMAYGHLVSRHVLRGAGILLLLMLLGAFKLERMRQQAAQLEADVVAAERERTLVEMRNVELSAEIRRREAAEARIGDRNEQLNAIFELSPDGFVSFDATRRVKYANPALLRMTGYAERELVGLDEAAFSERLAKDCVAGTRFVGIAALRAAKHATANGADETAQRGKPRQLVELAVPGAPVIELKLRLARSPTVSQILYLRDVTHEVEVERMKSEFLSHAAHELRTPMASIYGFSELLMTQEFDEATRKDLLATIHKQTQWLVDIINELLDLARIEARRGQDFRIEAVPLPSLLDEVVAAMNIDPARWPLATDCADNLPVLHADAAKLRQALTNVLGNAVKYSPEGGAIEIRCAAHDREGKHHIGIAVTDHGVGMRPDQVARVGERFYRADTSGRIPGTGLGMAIVKEIVELHGGGFKIDSAVGAGTTVFLWLPAEPRAAERNAA
jgi:signal transduction histidine kinase